MMFFNPFENTVKTESNILFSGNDLQIPSENDQILSRLAATVVNATISSNYSTPPQTVEEAAHNGTATQLNAATGTLNAVTMNNVIKNPTAAITESLVYNNIDPLALFVPSTISLLSHFSSVKQMQKHANYTTFCNAANIPYAKASSPTFQTADIGTKSIQGHAPTSACESCHCNITEQCFIQIGTQSWHKNCARCAMCLQLLSGLPSCYSRNGLLYCRQDYLQKFARCCERCKKQIRLGEIVMHATPKRTFHLACFTCVLCGWALNTGETYLLGANGTLICQRHYENLILQNTKNDASSQNFGGNTICMKSSTIISAAHTNKQPLEDKYDKEKHNFNCAKNKKSEMEETSVSDAAVHADDIGEAIHVTKTTNPFMRSESTNYLNMEHSGNIASTSASSFAAECSMDDEPSPGGMGKGNGNKAKRMRTSFKHQQLRMMKTYFTLNHNPDAKDLKQLALKTGLSKRVLQVWFQNARAKFRRAQQNHRADSALPRRDGESGEDSPVSGFSYVTKLQMLPNSADMNGVPYGAMSISERTSISPADSSTMYDGCSYVDDFVTSMSDGNEEISRSNYNRTPQPKDLTMAIL